MNEPWAYEDNTTYYARQAASWAEQAGKHVANAIAPAKMGVDGLDPALAVHNPTMFDQPLLDPEQQDQVLSVPAWVKSAASNYIQNNGLAVPRSKGKGLISHVSDALGVGGIGDVASSIGINQPWDVFKPIARLQELENRYISKPLVSGTYGQVESIAGRLGISLPDYNNLPGIIRMSLETIASPTTWLAPGVVEGVLLKAPRLAAALPATRALVDGIGSERAMSQTLGGLFIPSGRRVAETVAGAVGGAVGVAGAEAVGLPGIIGAFAGGGLADRGIGRLTATPLEKLGSAEQSTVREGLIKAMAPKEPEQPSQEMVTVYHGTTPDHAENIRANGLDAGSYVAMTEAEARSWAQSRANGQYATAHGLDWRDVKDQPISIIKFQVPKSAVTEDRIHTGIADYTYGTGNYTNNSKLTPVDELGQLRQDLANPDAVSNMIAEEARQAGRSAGGKTTQSNRKLSNNLQDSLIIAKAKQGIALTDEELPRAQKLLATLEQQRLEAAKKGRVAGVYQEPELDPRVAEILGLKGPSMPAPSELFSNPALKDLNDKLASGDLSDSEYQSAVQERLGIEPAASSAMRQALSGEDLGTASRTVAEVPGQVVPLYDIDGQLQATVSFRDGKYWLVKPKQMYTEGQSFTNEADARQAAIDQGLHLGSQATRPGFTDVNQQVLSSSYAKMSLEELRAEKEALQRGLVRRNDPTADPEVAAGASEVYNNLRTVQSWIDQKSGVQSPGSQSLNQGITGPIRNRMFRPPPTEGPGATKANYLTTVFGNLALMAQSGASTFNIDDWQTALQDARSRASITRTARQAAGDHLPRLVHDAATKLGIRLNDADANILIDQYSRMKSMGDNFGNASSTTSFMALQKAFNILPDNTVNVTPATRYKGRFLPKGISPTPTIQELIHTPHFWQLSPDQLAAIQAATAPIDEIRNLQSAFLVKGVSQVPDGHYFPLQEDPTNPGQYLDTRGSVQHYIQSSFGQIANRWLSESLKEIGTTRKVQEKLGNIRGVSSPPVAPFSTNYGGPDTISSLNGFFRPLMAGGDATFIGVQGLLTFFKDPVKWGQAIHAAVLGGTPELVQRMAEKGTLRSFVESGGLFKSRNDLGEFGFRGIFEDLPGPAGKFFQAANSSYNDFGNAIRLLHYDAGLPLARDITAQRALARSANLLSGVGAGTPTRLENIATFAPSFFRSTIGLVSDAATKFSGPEAISGQIARETLMKLIGGAAFLTYSINTMQGKPTDFDPTSRNFLKLHAFGQNISLLGPYDSLLKAAQYTMKDGPLAGGSYLARSKASPVVSRLWDLISGQDWSGNPTSLTHGDILQTLLTETKQMAVPIAFQNAAQEFQNHPIGQALGGSAVGFIGLKEGDLTLANKRDNLAQSEKGKDWSQLAPAERFQLQQLRPDIVSGVARSETAKAYAARQAISNRFATQQAQLDQQLPAGKAWRDAHSNLLQQQAGAYDQWSADHPDIALQNQTTKAATVEQQALNNYYQLFSQAHQEGWSPDEISQKMDLLQSSWTPSAYQYVQDNTGLHATPVAKEYRAAQQTLRPYWQLEDKLWAQLSATGQTQGSTSFHNWVLEKSQSLLDSGIQPGKVTQEINRLPLVRQYGQLLNQLHLQYRLANPAAEAALEKWYGLVPLHKGKAA